MLADFDNVSMKQRMERNIHNIYNKYSENRNRKAREGLLHQFSIHISIIS